MTDWLKAAEAWGGVGRCLYLEEMSVARVSFPFYDFFSWEYLQIGTKLVLVAKTQKEMSVW